MIPRHKYMIPYHKYMLFYSSVQLVGVIGIIKIKDWSEEKHNKK